jgi:hypothetical protein
VLVFPRDSPALGSLVVSFDPDEISLYFGPRGNHRHASVRDFPASEAARAVPEVARTALEFIRALLSDEIVVRWGFFVCSTYRRTGPPGALRRLRRTLTPWVTEAVWSGYL